MLSRDLKIGTVLHTQRALTALCLVFFALAGFWAFAVPLPLGDRMSPAAHYQPDEWNHVAVVAYMSRHRALPPYIFDYYQSAHPPMYHAVGAVLYAIVEPTQGTRVAVFGLRLFSVLLGTSTIWFIGRAAQQLLPARRALLAPIFVVGVPGFVSLSGAVTNEIGAAWASAGALYFLIRFLRRRRNQAEPYRNVILLSLFTAVAIGCKITCLPLLPAVVLSLLWNARWRRENGARTLRRVLLVIVLCALINGPWFARNQQLYGDILRQQASEQMWRDRIPGYAQIAARENISLPRYFASTTYRGFSNFWGSFNRASQPLAAPLLGTVVLLCAAAGVGLWKMRYRLGVYMEILAPLLLYFLGVVAIYYRYMFSHYTPQGRFFYPILLLPALLFALGWASLARRRRWLRSAVVLAMLLLSLIATAHHNPLYTSFTWNP